MGKSKGKKVSAAWARRQRKLKEDVGEGGSQDNSDKDENENDQKREAAVNNNSDEPVSSDQGQARKTSRRQSGEPAWEFDHFPPSAKFQPPSKLPTVTSVVGRVRHLTQGGKYQMKREDASKQVALEIESKYYHDTVYCIPLRTIERKVDKLMQTYINGKARLLEGRENDQVVKEYKELILEKDKLFNVATSSPEQKKVCEELWGVKIRKKEKVYLADQQGPRRMECDLGVDPVWFRAKMKDQRLREASDADYVSRREQQRRGKNFDEIEQMMRDDGEIPSEPPSEPDSANSTPVKLPANSVEQTTVENPVTKKKRLYMEIEEEDSDPMPQQFQHIRDSERMVKNEFYQTCADLAGYGLGADECSRAVVEVGNGMFGRKWKHNMDDSQTYDKDTAPGKKHIVESLSKIEAHSLSLMADLVTQGKEDGRMVTLASDSTTRKGVGQFQGQGIHIGNGSAFPLPLLSISSETREDIAEQLGMGLQILSICSGEPVDSLAGKLDTLLTDSVEHNKGVNEILAKLYDLDTAPGQIFCGTHTVLGFSDKMDKMVSFIETKMKLETVLAKFMVAIDLDSKHHSLASQALDMCLKLVAPEYVQKPWNYYKQYCCYLQSKEVEISLFSYKDHRFGCLSRAAAVLLHNYDHLSSFLDDNPQISNKLACGVRELLGLPYLKVIFCVYASLGIQLIEPFYARTIQQGQTHTTLQKFYKGLYSSLSTEAVSADFFSFSQPAFPGVSENLLKGVKESYGLTVLQSVVLVAQEQEDDVLLLINYILPELGCTLAKQRRDYGLDTELYPVQFPVEDQASVIDDTPTNNMDMERLMGKADQRLKKYQTLSATSRSIVLQKTQQLRANHGSSSKFRSFGPQVEARRQLELTWNKKQEEKFKTDSQKKQEVSLVKERKRLNLLEDLKASNGPFTNSDEVQLYLDDPLIDMKEKQRRFKREVQFARDSSTTLPKVSPIFKIQVTGPDKKRRDKTASEFGEALKVYLGKRKDRLELKFSAFKESLRQVAVVKP